MAMSSPQTDLKRRVIIDRRNRPRTAHCRYYTVVDPKSVHQAENGPQWRLEGARRAQRMPLAVPECWWSLVIAHW